MKHELTPQGQGIQRIILHIVPEDYQQEVEKRLKEIRKNTTMPGFRKGKVPLSLVRKQYGDLLKFEVLNELVRDYLKKQGESLPRYTEFIPADDEDEGETLPEGEYRFTYDWLSEPAFEFDLDELRKIPRYKPAFTEEEMKEALTKWRWDLGDHPEPEVTGPLTVDHWVVVLPPADGEGEPRPYLINARPELTAEGLKPKKEGYIKWLGGKKKGETLQMNARDFRKLLKELDTDEEFLQQVPAKGKLDLKLEGIWESRPLDWVTAYQRLTGNEDEPELKGDELAKEVEKIYAEKLREELQSRADRIYRRLLEAKVRENIKGEIPHEFLKRLILARLGRDEWTEELENIYPELETEVIYEILKEKWIKEKGLKIQPEEYWDLARAEVTRMLLRNPELKHIAANPQTLDRVTRSLVESNEDLKQRINQMVTDLLLLRALEEELKPEEEEKSMDEINDLYFDRLIRSSSQVTDSIKE